MSGGFLFFVSKSQEANSVNNLPAKGGRLNKPLEPATRWPSPKRRARLLHPLSAVQRATGQVKAAALRATVYRCRVKQQQVSGHAFLDHAAIRYAEDAYGL